MLLQCVVSVHRYPLPSSRPIGTLDEDVPRTNVCFFLRMQVLFLAFSMSEVCCHGLCSIDLQLLSFCPVDAQSGAHFDCSDNMEYVVRCHHLSDVAHDGLMFDSADLLLQPMHAPRCVNCKEVWRQQCTQWYTLC